MSFYTVLLNDSVSTIGGVLVSDVKSSLQDVLGHVVSAAKDEYYLFEESTSIAGIQTPGPSEFLVDFSGYTDDTHTRVATVYLSVTWYGGSAVGSHTLGAARVDNPSAEEFAIFLSAYQQLVSATSLEGAHTLFSSALKSYITDSWDVYPVFTPQADESYLYFGVLPSDPDGDPEYHEVYLLVPPKTPGGLARVVLPDDSTVRVNSFALYQSV